MSQGLRLPVSVHHSFCKKAAKSFEINRDFANLQKARCRVKQVDRAISLHGIALIILSENSVNSDWVEYEVDKAREKEKLSGKDTLCPVALDASWKDCRWSGPLRKQIEKYRILDFANWHDAAHFHKMFGKLLEGLNLFYK